MRPGRPVVQFLLLAGLAVADSAAGMQRCPDVADPPGAVCVAATHGLAYAGRQDDAELAAAALDVVAARFQQVFGRPPASGVLVLSSTFATEDGERFAQTHGLEFSQSWLSPGDKRAQVETAIRRAMPDAGPDRIEAIVSQVEARHVDTLRHELGHAQYRAAFWPHAQPDLAQYGTPAPDWLDEASAVLMEDEPGRAARERHFIDARRQSSPAIRPLAEFLAMAHPMTAARRAQLEAEAGTRTTSGIQVMVASGPDAPAMGMFYAQSLLFSDFLLDASGDPTILGTISTALADGVGFADWLADSGALHGLPADISTLQAAWDNWCETRDGAVVDPAG